MMAEEVTAIDGGVGFYVEGCVNADR